MDVNTPVPTFTLIERRILGVMVEKAKTTPETYPLSLNSLTTGCNQKSNRDPVLSLDEEEVESCLNQLQKTVLVTRLQGGRVERWKHNLYEQWNVNKVELAILAELLLRGAQTEGELRTRASRMEPIADLEGLREALKPLVARGLVVFLGDAGRRGTQIMHGFCPPRELEALKSRTQGEVAAAENLGHPVAPVQPNLGDSLQKEVNALKAEVQQMRAEFQALAEQVRQLRSSLGG